MTKAIALAFSFFIFPLITAVSQEKQSEVLIISTIHGAHKVNSKYSYDSLFKFIDSFDPEIIGVEIREEDRDSSFNYLENNYPFEMYECLKKYPSKTVMGFDWL